VAPDEDRSEAEKLDTTGRAEREVVWGDFFQDHRRYVEHVLRRCGLPERSREDCVQEVWLEVVQRLPEFRARRRPQAVLKWLSRIARAKAADWHRQTRVVRFASELEAAAVAEEDPAATALRRERDARIYRGMACLRGAVSASTYFVVEKRCLEGFSVEDVCRWTGKQPQHVWDRQRRGLKKLRAILRFRTPW
jgi:RNA polymerase sigma factor (sigma-70 family)